MDQLTITAASGMRSRIESLDLLANNIANAGTAGYKADREFYNLYISAEAGDPEGATLPVIERNWVDLSQGVLKQTGNPLDLALSGRGFLAADAPGGTVYTRNGSLRVSRAGVLETGDGYPVRALVKGVEGRHIQARIDQGPPNLEIKPDGTVLQDGELLGKLELADWKQSEPIEKQGGSYFRLVDPKLKPAAAAGVEVFQGSLEGSNAVMAESAVRLVSVLRQFEMLQKAITLGAEMNKKAIEEVARPGG